jgi:hypothetical protein
LALATLAATLAISGIGTDPGGEPSSQGLKPVHYDALALEDAVLGAMRAFLREDTAAMRRSFDRMEESTRRLDREKDQAYGSDLITWEEGFHGTIDRGRELSGKGRLEDAFDQLMWSQKACVGCHKVARKKGFLPVSAQPDIPSGGEPGDGR